MNSLNSLKNLEKLDWFQWKFVCYHCLELQLIRYFNLILSHPTYTDKHLQFLTDSLPDFDKLKFCLIGLIRLEKSTRKGQNFCWSQWKRGSLFSLPFLHLFPTCFLLCHVSGPLHNFVFVYFSVSNFWTQVVIKTSLLPISFKFFEWITKKQWSFSP